MKHPSIAAIVGRSNAALLGVLRRVPHDICTRYAFMSDVHPDNHKSMLELVYRPTVAAVFCPYVISNLDADRVWCVVDDGASAVAAKLSSHPEWDRWRRELDPGEFWSSVGEDWVRACESRVTTLDEIAAAVASSVSRSTTSPSEPPE